MPTRPALRVLCVIGLVTSLLAGCGGGSDDSKPQAIEKRQPNVVFLVVDDLDLLVSPYWDAMPKTAALIRDRGLTFDNLFATDPVCCPARATLLTGMYPHNTRVFSSEGGLESFRTRASKWTIGVRMKEAGYSTAFIGKYLNGYELDPSYVPPGWDEWFGLAGKKFLTGYDYQANHNGRIESFGTKNKDYQTDVIRRVATDFVASHVKAPDPFLLTLFPSAPHAPIGPAKRDKDNQFVDDSLPDRANDDDDLAGKPTWLRVGLGPASAEAKQNALAQYRKGLGSLMAVDDMVGAIAS
jgi:arylsulfatase A-like enzyme